MKRTLTVLLVLILVLGLRACKPGTETGNQSSAPNNSTEAAQIPDPKLAECMDYFKNSEKGDKQMCEIMERLIEEENKRAQVEDLEKSTYDFFITCSAIFTVARASLP